MPAITDLRTDIIEAIQGEWQLIDPLFEDVFAGKLPRLMGFDANYVGVSPVDQTPSQGNVLVQNTEVLVQIHLQYPTDKPINPKLVIDPAPIEAIAERFQELIEEGISNSTGARWYLQITDINYPDDPVGQKTRVNINIIERGNNVAIVETTP